MFAQLSPSITSMTITTSDGVENLTNDPPLERILSDARWDALAGRLAEAAPRLESFSIWSSLGRFLGRVPALSSSITRFSKRLSTLAIHALTLDKSTFTHIGQLSSLKNLTISLFEMHIADIEAVGPMELPHLEILQLRSTSMPACTSFLSRYTMESLSWLSLTLDIQAHQDIAPLIAALASKGVNKHLERLSILKDDYRRPGNDLAWAQMSQESRFIVGRAALRTLASFNKLSRLNIGRCTHLEIDDGDFINFFAACPLLTSFSLDSESIDPAVPKLTLKGVPEALKAVPQLNHLKVTVDFTTIPADEEPIAPHESLAFWDAQNSPLSSGIELASWLSRYYPSLAKIEFFAAFHTGLRSVHLWGHDSDELRDLIDGQHDTAVMYARWLDARAHLEGRCREVGEFEAGY